MAQMIPRAFGLASFGRLDVLVCGTMITADGLRPVPVSVLSDRHGYAGALAVSAPGWPRPRRSC